MPFEDRRGWDALWIVDPVDGTKEFIKRNGEFTVNVALVKAGRVVCGVVLAPVLGHAYVGEVGSGAWRCEVDMAGDTSVDQVGSPSGTSLGPTPKPSVHRGGEPISHVSRNRGLRREGA